MADYTVGEVQSILGIPRSVISGLVKAGFVAPARGKRREYRFSFQDVVVLRTAQELISANIAPRRIVRSLKHLREGLPRELPLAGLRITAVGSEITIKEGGARRNVDSGQLLLDFEIVTSGAGSIAVLSPTKAATEKASPAVAVRQPADDSTRAEAAYRTAIRKDPRSANAYVDLALLLSEQSRQAEAEIVYRQAIEHCPGEAMLHFNLATVLEDLQRLAEALSAYEAALHLDAGFADAHFNAARLHELLGHARQAIRHYSEYRRLQE